MIEYFIKKRGEVEKIGKCIDGCWINVINPTESEVDSLVKDFELDKEIINQGLDIYEEPRFEVEDKKTYIFLSAPTEKIHHEYMSSFLVVYSKKNLITISKYNLEILEKLYSLRNIRIFNSERNLLRILYFISKSFEDSVHKIAREIKRNRTELSKLREKDIRKLIEYEDILNNYITPFGEIIHNYTRILNTKLIILPERDEDKLEDLIIALNETLNLCKSSLKTITNMRNYYSTQLSTNLNKTVTILTIFTIFLAIPTLIASVYGMNVNLPLQSSSKLLIILGGVVFGIWISMFSLLKILKLI